jgi:EAL domain-containing protein (putative c-di-GMP-specific phosphodiesterase class I)
MVSPAEFIPLAEDSGLILQLGEFVLGEVCKQLQGWQQSGAELVPVAVNFSGHQFSNRGMVKSLLRVLEHYSLASRFIEVELTESVVSDNHALVNDILGELRQCGIRTAIDDFGTGYSSLSSLRKFPFHTLKIDRSFVHDMNHDVSATSIVGSIIEMGHALGMQVVAEGVEDEQQLDLLRNHGCDVIQGYLTGRPVSAEEIGARLLI